MTVRILTGDVRTVLPTLESDSVHCVVTSPPYWGLRSYLPPDHADKHLEIGSEPTLQDWVDTMVEVFREVRRVLRPDGTLWLNLGDAYNSGTSKPSGASQTADVGGWTTRSGDAAGAKRVNAPGLKVKDMMGQPWRVAFALQADGWWLRQEIIWNKPNPMPESTRDRCTKAHEHIFLLSKSERYFYDFDAMQEPVSGTANARKSVKTPDGWDTSKGEGGHGTVHKAGREKGKYQNNGVGFGHGFDADPKPRTVGAVGRREGPPGNPPETRPTTRASHNMGREPGWRSNGVTPKAELGETVGYAEGKAARLAEGGVGDLVDTRNPRSVWTIPTHGFKGAHFATFPPELASRCITAGTSQIGCCPHCGAPWVTLTESAHSAAHDGETDTKYDEKSTAGRLAQLRQAARERGEEYSSRRQVTGHAPSCECVDNVPTPCTVLDPFGGSGTVGLVADRQHKHAILIDLDERNVPMAQDRITGESSLFAQVES